MASDPNTPAPVSAPRLGLADFATMSITFFALGVTLQVLLIETGTPTIRAFIASAVIFSATSEFAYLAVKEGAVSYTHLTLPTIYSV